MLTGQECERSRRQQAPPLRPLWKGWTARPPCCYRPSRTGCMQGSWLAFSWRCAGEWGSTLSSLDAAVAWRRVTSFACPSGGAPTVRQRARLYTSRPTPLCNDGGPGAEYADCADCGPRFPPLRPCAPRRATGLPTPIATTAVPARVPPGPGPTACGTGPSSIMW